MFESNKHQKLMSCLALAALCGATQGVHAHAGFKEAIDSGTANTWNAVTVTHGCNTNAGGESNGQPHKDVIALSVVFPDFTNTSKVVMRKSKGTVPAQTSNVGATTTAGTATIGDETVIPDLSTDIVGSDATVALKASISTDMGGDQIFVNNIPTADANGNIRGWQSWNGPKPVKGPVLLESAKKPDGSDISTTGLSPFRISGIQFKEGSCVKSLKIRVAVANWCGKGNASYKNRAANADIWVGSKTTLFNDPATMPNESQAIFWPTLTVNNTGYDEAACASAEYDTVYIEPKVEDIDAMLPMRKQKFPKGSGEKFWPTE